MRKQVFLAVMAFFVSSSLMAGSAAGLTALGYVDLDGAKLGAVAIEYDVELESGDVSPLDYETDLPVTRVYISDGAPFQETGKGRFVVLELDSAPLQASEQSFLTTMAVEARQVRAIKDGAVASCVIRNYEEIEEYNSFRKTWVTVRRPFWGSYLIRGIEGFKYYTDLDSFGVPDGPAFKAEDCFSEIDGTYNDEDLSYALFVPEDYDPEGRYALVTIENPAAAAGTHPYQSVLETRSPALMASSWAQDYVKEKHGLDGLIVVVPTVTERVDDNGCTPSQYEAIVRLWDKILDDYSIDRDHVYGMGQSVGGMILLETNRNRDNFFSAVIMFENQWAQNYYKDTLFSRNIASDPEVAASAPMHYPRADSYITWPWHYEGGEKVYEGHDPYNFYYLVSDDNVLVMNRGANNLSNGAWQELSYLYEDLAGVAIPHLYVDARSGLDAQEDLIDAFLAAENPLGIRIVTFDGGANGYSARKVLSGYKWLLSQDKPAREKLDINKPFRLAEGGELRPVENYTDLDGGTVYYKNAAPGSGTRFYNSSWMNLTTVLDAEPGWLPEGMSWERGVASSEIVSITQEEKTLTVTYSEDMTGAVVRLKGDAIPGWDGSAREDLSCVLGPYRFYGSDGEELGLETAALAVDGNVIAVTLSSAMPVSSVSQQTTIHSDRVIASALPWRVEVQR